jgi:hypothetical protein
MSKIHGATPGKRRRVRAVGKVVYTAAQVAAHLDLTGSMVRRYGLAYEAVTGEDLPRDPKSHGRLYSEEVLGILEQARGIVRANNNVSAEDAIRMVLNLTTVSTAPAIPNGVITQELLDLIREQTREIKAMRQETSERLQALERENATLREQMKALTPGGQSLDLERLTLLERRNHYLFQELQRRDKLAERHQRAWWQFWA